MTKRRPRSPPDTSNRCPRARGGGALLPTLPSPLSLRPRLRDQGRGLPARYHAPAINRVEHPRVGVALASGVVAARAKPPATCMPEACAATRPQHVCIVPLQILSIIYISEPTSPYYISYVFFCLNKKIKSNNFAYICCNRTHLI